MPTLRPLFVRGRAHSFRSGGLSACLLLALVAGRASGQGFAGRWEPTLGTGPARTVLASTMFDFDGTGAVPVIGTGEGIPRVLAKRGGEWVQLGAAFSAFDINAFAAFDPDGDGPLPVQLIAAGHFTVAGTTTVNRVARWDGTAWQPMGTGLGDAVYALAVFDPDGSGPQAPQLIAGGRFLQRGTSGGPVLNGVARWDGVAWQPLGSGVTSGPTAEVHALSVFDVDGDGPLPPKLIVGGSFTTAGGAPASNIAAWDGSAWSPLGAGVGGASAGLFAGIVSALYEDRVEGGGARLIVGGYFTTAGGAPAGAIAQWDGASWQRLGNENLSYVLAITRYDSDGDGPLPSRLVVGKFPTTSGVPAHVAQFDGASWQPVGAGVTANTGRAAYTLTVDSSTAGAEHARLIAGGTFSSIGGMWSPLLAEWNGSTWSRIASGRSGENANDAVVFDADGAGAAAPQLVTLGGNILSWSGGDWEPFNNQVITDFAAQALGLYDESGSGGQPSTLLMGGTVFNDDDTTFGVSFELAESGWQQFGPSDVGFTRSIMFDPDGPGPQPAQLVVTTGRAVYRWDGETWQPLGGLTNATSTVSALAAFDPDGVGPLPPQLVVAGAFTSIGGVPLNRVARWDGAAWQPFGNGLGGSVLALAVLDPDGDGPQAPRLIAAGGFTTLGGVGGAPANRLAQWDGASWSQFGGGASSLVTSLLVEDPDGAGARPAELYAGGQFITIGGVSVPRIARWDGARWHAVGDGVDTVTKLLFYTPPGEAHQRLVAFGPRAAGAWATPGIAMLSARTSPADVGSAGGVAGPDGAFNNNDFIAFINLFFAGDSNADIGRAGGLPGADGLFDNNDFIAFISFFFAG